VSVVELEGGGRWTEDGTDAPDDLGGESKTLVVVFKVEVDERSEFVSWLTFAVEIELQSTSGFG